MRGFFGIRLFSLSRHDHKKSDTHEETLKIIYMTTSFYPYSIL